MSGEHTSTPVAARVRRLEARLTEAGVVTEEQLDAALAAMLAGASPVNGARIVARAWTDPGFRERLLADANAALPEVGLSMAGGIQEQRLKVVENTATTHHVLVCTLCSCYPIGLLGPSPSWYKSEAYRSRVVREPRAVLAEFGLELPDGTTITVWDSSAESRYMVLPRRPEGTGDGARRSWPRSSPGRASSGPPRSDSAALPRRPQELAVHRRDAEQRDALGAGGGALSGEGAAAEALLVHLRHHVQHPGPALGRALRQHIEMVHLGGGEQHRGPVRAGRHAGPAADALGVLERGVGVRLGHGVAWASGAAPVGAVM